MVRPIPIAVASAAILLSSAALAQQSNPSTAPGPDGRDAVAPTAHTADF
jgi:hypothetical protein